MNITVTMKDGSVKEFIPTDAILEIETSPDSYGW